MWRFAKEKTCGFIAAQLDTPMDVKLEQQTGDSWLKRPSHSETIPGFSKPDKKSRWGMLCLRSVKKCDKDTGILDTASLTVNRSSHIDHE